jgi:D-alanine-D-alanine ligase
VARVGNGAATARRDATITVLDSYADCVYYGPSMLTASAWRQPATSLTFHASRCMRPARTGCVDIPAKGDDPVRICLLTTQRLDARPFPDDDWPCDPRPFLPEADWHVATLRKKTSVAQVRKLLRQGFDLYFNLCDGASEQDVPGIEVVRTLEEAGVPFTGATSRFYEPSREQMKLACAAEGISTPAYVLARGESDVEFAAATLRFPLFVKHHNSYASVDISRASRVRTPAGLRRQARKIMSRHGAALVEEFVEGTECTVLVAENPHDPHHPTTYMPMQYRFPPGESFKHEKIKWVEYEQLACAPVDDPALEARLRDIAARFFVALDGASFGRCDVRVDRDGTPFMLEMNANFGIYYPPTDPGSADLCLSHDPAGHEGFTRQLVEAALMRHERRKTRHRPRRVSAMRPDVTAG